MKVLVTGAAGFLGRACVGVLRGAGVAVTTTDRAAGVDIVGDLASPAFCRGLPGADTVVHCASVQYLSPDLPWLARQEYFHRNNVEATRNLADRYRNNVAHFVYIGTSMVYRQDGSFPLSPSSPMAPQGVYSASKISALQVARTLPNPVAIVLPTIIAGAGRGGLFDPFVKSVKRLGVAVIPGTGEHPIHVVHVEDVASLIAKAVERRANGIFNAGGPGPLSILRWVEEIASELDVAHVRCLKIPLGLVAAPAVLSGYRLMAREQLLMLQFPHVLDTASSESLGWEPRWSNAATVRETARARL